MFENQISIFFNSEVLAIEIKNLSTEIKILRKLPKQLY